MMTARTAAMTMMNGQMNLQTRIQIYDRFTDIVSPHSFPEHREEIGALKQTPRARNNVNGQLTFESARMESAAATPTPIPIPP